MPDLIAVVASLQCLFLHHLESQRHAEVDLRQAQPDLHLLNHDGLGLSSLRRGNAITLSIGDAGKLAASRASVLLLDCREGAFLVCVRTRRYTVTMILNTP